jgi:hypothetical protein
MTRSAGAAPRSGAPAVAPAKTRRRKKAAAATATPAPEGHPLAKDALDPAELAADVAEEVHDEGEPGAKPAPSIPTNWRKRFLAHLGETSNIAAAARHARVPVRIVYKHRRADPVFRAKWFEALAEGYDNLEMELLQHLRAIESEDAPPPPRGKFDTATAFRCLAAHRESVLREKGRRSLAEEVATIESINAKIDRLRLNERAADKAIRAARESNRARTAGAAADGE